MPVALALVVLTGAGGCGGDDLPAASPAAVSTTATTTATVPAPTPPFEVGTVTETLVDTTRVTPATSQQPERPSRTLVTTIIYPDSPGPFPLIVFSHGLTGTPERHTELSSAWARAGYVVAMPAFPLTNAAVPDASTNAGDVKNQPGDVSFVIDRMIAANRDSTSPVFSRILPDRIGIAGHSLGAATTYAVAQNDCCRDDRVDAVMIMSGVRLVNLDGDHLDRMPPIMMLHGDADPLLNVQIGDDVYAQLNAPKWFVRLLGAGHAPAYENTPSPWDDVVTASTTDFWQAYLPPTVGPPDPATLDRLRADAVLDKISTLQADPG